MGFFDGKKGVILGVANDFSIAWAISQKLVEQGAELGFTHLPGEKMRRRVSKLSEPLGSKMLESCDVQKDEDIAAVFAKAKEVYGSIDFVLHSIAFAPLEDIKNPVLKCSRDGFKMAMEISAYSLAAVSKYASEVMNPGGSILTLTYYGGATALDNQATSGESQFHPRNSIPSACGYRHGHAINQRTGVRRMSA